MSFDNAVRKRRDSVDVGSVYDLCDGASPDEGFILPEVNDTDLVITRVDFRNRLLHVEPDYDADSGFGPRPDVGLWVRPDDLVEQED